MQMHDKLIKLIEVTTPLSGDEILAVETAFEPVLFPKNRIIEEAGAVPKYLYFVVAGFVRLFYYDEQGNEVTSHINCPPGFITSYFSFVQQTKAQDNVECVTECELLRISKASLDELFEQSEHLKNFSIAIFQESLAYNEKRANELATLSAEQRYRALLAKSPEILYHVPLQYIASFLGIKPESLSRIRKKILL
jgi:CRP-like cAMP-binding protein